MTESAPLCSELQTHTFQEAMSNAGNEHKYQKRLIFLMSLHRLSLGFLFTAFPFLFKEPEFQCRSPGSEEFFSCQPTIENCLFNIEPVPGSENSLITYFHLYCGREELGNIAKNIFTAACGIGLLILFPLADKMGRKPGLVGSYVLGSLSLLLAPFTSNWAILVTLLAISGMAFSPYMTSSFLVLNEASNAKIRALASVIVNSAWTCGQIAGGILAYWLNNDWRAIILVGLGAPLTLLIPLVLAWVYESPMFLVSKRKYQDARNILGKIARINGHTMANFEFTEEKKNAYSITISQKNYNFVDLIKYKSLRTTTVLGAFLCFSIYFNYYGTIFTLASVQVNTYELTVILGVAEFISYLTSGYMTHNFTRRFSFSFCSAVCCAANFLFVLFPVPDSCEVSESTCYQIYAQLILSIINRFAVSIMLAMSGLYMNELYPTPVRALGPAITIFIGRLGSFTATVAIAACLEYGISPILLFALVSFPAIVVSMIMKETKGLPLPEFIEEEDPNHAHFKQNYRKKGKSLYLTFT